MATLQIPDPIQDLGSETGSPRKLLLFGLSVFVFLVPCPPISSIACSVASTIPMNSKYTTVSYNSNLDSAQSQSLQTNSHFSSAVTPSAFRMDDDAIDTFEDEFDVEEEDNDGDDDRATKGDGLADMMSKILNQKVGDKIPVLAKRKTTLMKEMEGSHIDSDRLKRQRAEKKADREKQLVVPDLTSADFERQLRKLATRGGTKLLS